jgi:hypothetical protein
MLKPQHSRLLKVPDGTSIADLAIPRRRPVGSEAPISSILDNVTCAGQKGLQARNGRRALTAP